MRIDVHFWGVYVCVLSVLKWVLSWVGVTGVHRVYLVLRAEAPPEFDLGQILAAGRSSTIYRQVALGPILACDALHAIRQLAHSSVQLISGTVAPQKSWAHLIFS